MSNAHTFELIAEGRKIEGVSFTTFPTERDHEARDQNISMYFDGQTGSIVPMNDIIKRRLNNRKGLMHKLRVTAI